VLDYDKEAASYDATRGGEPRAAAAARAVAALLPPETRRLIDLGCGTGIVTARLPGAAVGIDRSAGMAAVAAVRLPGRIAVGDVTRLPVASGAADAVTVIWLLHLLEPAESAAAIAEVARVLRPSGVLITTVNKSDAAYHDGDDAAMLIRDVWSAVAGPKSDDERRVTQFAAEHGMVPAGTATFRGEGQGRSPLKWRAMLSSGRFFEAQLVDEPRMRALDEAIAALPDQHRPRPEPVYTLLALRTAGPV